MLINSTQTNLYPKNCQTKQFNNALKSCHTNPASFDTFTPTISFKAAIHTHAANGSLMGIRVELANGVDVNIQDGPGGDTALMEAAWNNHIEIVKELLLQPNIDVNISKSCADTALTLASFKGHYYVVRELLKHPDIDVNSPNDDKSTPLMLAIKKGKRQTIKELLKHPNIDLSLRNKDGKSALDYAKDSGNSEIIQMVENYVPGVDKREDVGEYGRLVKKTPVNINKLSPEENIWGKEEISAEFLKFVQNKKYEDAAKMLEITPLIDLEGNNNDIMVSVCSTGKPDFVRKVFEYERMQPQMQADYDSQRKNFFGIAIRILSYDELKANNITLNTIDGFKVLMENPEFNPNDTVENSSLFERACRLDPEGSLAKEILSKYGDVNTANAAKTSNKVIKDLIENYEKVGKYRMVLNSIENNAFYADERRGVAANQLKALLESPNFTPEIADEVGNSVLHIAAALPDDMGRTLIQMALDKGVDIDAGNCTGQRPLMSAIKKLVTTDDNAGKMNLMANIKFLLDKGADVNAQDNNGQTAFHFACISTVAALLTLLLSKNPNVFLPDKHGNRAAKYLKTPEMKEIYNKYLGAV